MQNTIAQTTFPRAFIEQQARDAALYYSESWLQLISGLYGYRIIPLMVQDQTDAITGYLPLCLISSPLTGRRLVSLPFSDYCPILALDDSTVHKLVHEALALARHEKVNYLELRTGRHEALALRNDLVESNLYVRWLLPLTADPTETWKQLRKPVQHQIKKSRKAGVTVRVASSKAEMDQYYQLHLQTRSKKHGMPAQPRSFFTGIWEQFADSQTVQLLLAEYEEKTIAGMVIFTSGDTVRYAYGASDEAYLPLAPNNLLMWKAIEWSCEQGYKVLDMGRTARENEGLMEYKRRWGAIQEPLPYYYAPASAGLAATSEQS